MVSKKRAHSKKVPSMQTEEGELEKEDGRREGKRMQLRRREEREEEEGWGRGAGYIVSKGAEQRKKVKKSRRRRKREEEEGGRDIRTVSKLRRAASMEIIDQTECKAEAERRGGESLR